MAKFDTSDATVKEIRLDVSDADLDEYDEDED